MPHLTESNTEQDTLDTLELLGYEVAYGPDIAYDGDRAERDSRAKYSDVVLQGRLRYAVERFNSELPDEAIDEVVRKVLQVESPSLIENNRRFQAILRDGVDVSWMDDVSGEQHKQARIIDEKQAINNNWLAVNQFTVLGGERTRRADVVLFVNGLPLVVIELKNPGDENASLTQAWQQLQTYKDEIPALFYYNALLVISDGMSARSGTITAGWDRFMPWRTIDGSDLYREPNNPQQQEGTLHPGLSVLLPGIFEPSRFLDYCLNFITFEDQGDTSDHIAKKAAAYHQYHAVNKALESSLNACGIEAPAHLNYGRFPEAEANDPFAVHEPKPAYHVNKQFGDRRIGIIWHTQGSGKSLSMLFYASKLIRHPYMHNPTVVVITDRNDLDDQLFNTFANNARLLRQTPKQAHDRAHLKSLLQVSSGGVVFTTIQKFLPGSKGANYPKLSDRNNIVVISDEAHRSQYDFIDGFARHMHDALPNASFIGFTGTPIEKEDKSTQNVFGNHIDIYDIQRAVEDGATVPIYYENRLAKIELNEHEKPHIDSEIETITEDEEEQANKRKIHSKWSSIEALVGTDKRINLVANDLIQHFEDRQQSLTGKAMIVCMSRRICVAMYQAITQLRPEWHSDDDNEGVIKVVMSGSASDATSWQQHIRNKRGRDALAQRFKDPNDDLKIVIVRDMWLTGFDCPSLHTMYLDKPMKGHNLMQAIARVNRVFRDKPGGRVVDYLGVAHQLKQALMTYTDNGGQGEPTINIEEAVAILLEKHEIVCDLLHGFDYHTIVPLSGHERMTGIANAIDFILGLEDGKKRFKEAVTALSKAFALASPEKEALAIRDEVGLFQEIRSQLVKTTTSNSAQTPEAMDTAIQQLVSRAVSSNEVVDIFSAAGLDKPDISILSDEFLAELKDMPQKNLALESLKKLLNDDIKTRSQKDYVEAKRFSEMLEQAVKQYQNRALTTAQVIDEMINLAQQMRASDQKAEELGLNEDEVAFYNALADNDSAQQVLGDEQLKIIAQELVEKVRNNVSIDWANRDSARANIKRLVKRTLRKYGYPPDQQQQATDFVLEQAKCCCDQWVRSDNTYV